MPKRNKAQLEKRRTLGTQSLPYDAISLAARTSLKLMTQSGLRLATT